MKTKALAFSAAASLAAVAGFAAIGSILASSAPASVARPAAEIAHYVESAFHGKVTAIEFDAPTDKPAHYHIDVRFPRGSLARLATVDVDAVTKKISPHRDVHVPGQQAIN